MGEKVTELYSQGGKPTLNVGDITLWAGVRGWTNREESQQAVQQPASLPPDYCCVTRCFMLPRPCLLSHNRLHSS